MINHKRFNPIIDTIDDSLFIPEVGNWALQKYTYFGYYCDIFTNSMKGKWNNLIYIDLFSGSGFSKIKDTGRIIYGSPLIALSVQNPFTKYVFCEKDENCCTVLQERVNRLFREKDVKILNGDSNDMVETIISHIPKFSKQNTGLSFTFIDPFSLNLHFKTIAQLSELRIDFLILLAFHMDANRNFNTYYEQENYKIDSFLDDKNWRNALKEGFLKDSTSFVQFLGDSYRKKMEQLGYISTYTFVHIHSDKKNLPLYYLAFFSKDKLGGKFWKEVKKYTNPQTDLF